MLRLVRVGAQSPTPLTPQHPYSKIKTSRKERIAPTPSDPLRRFAPVEFFNGSLMYDIDQTLLSHAMSAVRLGMPSCDWSRHADSIVADRIPRERHLSKPQHKVDRSLFTGIDKLRNDGVVIHRAALAHEKAIAIRKHLEGLPLYSGIGGDQFYRTEPDLRPLADVQRNAPMGQYTPEQLMATPHLIDFLNDPAIIDFLELALGCVPTLYSIRAWWSFAANTPTGLNQQYFHRDTDDWRFVTLFLYLTDVDESSGPHQLIAGSHTRSGMQALVAQARAKGMNDVAIDIEESFANMKFFGVEFSANCERLFRDAIVNVEGPAGTMFMANTIAIHRGLKPSKTPRLIVWARYGLGPNTNVVELENGPVSRSQVATELPGTARNRYINRLLFEFDRHPRRVASADAARMNGEIDKDARIRELELSLQEADERLMSLKMEDERDSVIEQLERDLQALRNSTSWRATAFLRNAMGFLRQGK